MVPYRTKNVKKPKINDLAFTYLYLIIELIKNKLGLLPEVSKFKFGSNQI